MHEYLVATQLHLHIARTPHLTRKIPPDAARSTKIMKNNNGTVNDLGGNIFAVSFQCKTDASIE